MRRIRWATILACVAALAASGCNPDPGYDTTTPNYRSIEEGTDTPSSGERGSMMITEVGWAGSVTDEGVWDPEDVFIEFQNMHPRPINMSGWRIVVEGDFIKTYVIPSTTQVVMPNDFFVVAAKPDGAFGEAADVVLPELRLGKTYLHIDLRDPSRKKMESAGSDSEKIFTGGYDTYSTRSMERVQLIFGNQGGLSRNWHAYSDDVGFATIADGWRNRTFASPGVSNSKDYSGSSVGGGFE